MANHYRAHWHRMVAIETALQRLIANVLPLDTTARHPGQRELYRAMRLAPVDTVKRYRRLCNIIARYRVRGYL